MKNTLKYLSIIATFSSMFIGTCNVFAADTCEAGEEIHTDYVMMLDAGDATELNNQINAAVEGTTYTHTNAADKYHGNIKGHTIIGQGNVQITFNGKKTTTDSNPSVTWSAQDYYRKYYAALRGENKAGAGNSWSYAADGGKENYLMHDNWYSCNNEQCSITTSKTALEYLQSTRKGLLDFLESASESELTSFISEGNLFPNSTISATSDLATFKDDLLQWKIIRRYAKGETATGRDFNGDGKNTIFAPAAYYVKYCVKSSGSGETGSKTIEYDANTTDKVTNMPGNQSFTDECVNLDSKTPTREGYDFVGWATNGAVSTADYQPGDKYCGDSVTLMAIWKRKGEPSNRDFTVTYDANGGKNAPATQNGKAGQCVKISSAKPTLEKNNFLGWSTDKNAKEPDGAYKAGADYCGANGDITLYAVWQTQTGISAHLIAFGTVALVAGGALLVAKKKELFRQI